MLNPEEFEGVFGHTFVTAQRAPLLSIGNRSWTRHQLVSRVGVGNFKAIRILQGVLQDIRARTLEDLLKIAPEELAARRGVGTTTLYAVMCLLDAEGIDVRQWYSVDRTFGTLKRRNAVKKKKPLNVDAPARHRARQARRVHELRA